jgi:predicted dehydrogenase/threonine dehydrogenase-like Zn-dependent dehydrogenase
MKQLVQDWKVGSVQVLEVPAPQLTPGRLLVRTGASLISAGTERMVVEFAEKSLFEKARARPDLVRQVIGKVQREGILSTLESVRGRLEQPLLLGYSSAGTIVDLPPDVEGFRVGDRVVCAGGGYASHAEIVSVPRNLVVRLPEGTAFDSAAFTTLGAIALQGIRLADVRLGELVAVVGLGLVGQLSVQLLKAAGCRVAGIDPDPLRVELALRCGADAATTERDALESQVAELSDGIGADAVLITASTSSSEPVEMAGVVARDKAVVVAVGAVGLALPRKLYYMKELNFRVSRSYGPGRYDVNYEERGQDYPVGYVRWTENRNMQAFVQLLTERKLNLDPLITHRFSLVDAQRAYQIVTGQVSEPSLGIILEYPDEVEFSGVELQISPNDVPLSVSAKSGSPVRLGLIGPGAFASSMLLPALKAIDGVELCGVASAHGVSARRAADRFGFKYCSSTEQSVLGDSDTNAVVIATRHNLHGRQVLAALRAGKHVFVEKPLAICEEELNAVKEELSRRPSQILMVGFNRRFAPLAQELKEFFDKRPEPLMVHYRINAGYVPPDHWTQDPAQGGGRIIGEVCHFVDFIDWLVGAVPASLQAQSLPDSGRYKGDNLVLQLRYAGGHIGVVTYVANGDRQLGKERIEVHAAGRSAVLDDFRRLELVERGRRRVRRSWLRQDKGHRGELRAFINSVRGEQNAPIPFGEILAATRITFQAVQRLRMPTTTVQNLVTEQITEPLSEHASARSFHA